MGTASVRTGQLLQSRVLEVGWDPDHIGPMASGVPVTRGGPSAMRSRRLPRTAPRVWAAVGSISVLGPFLLSSVFGERSGFRCGYCPCSRNASAPEMGLGVLQQPQAGNTTSRIPIPSPTSQRHAGILQDGHKGLCCLLLCSACRDALLCPLSPLRCPWGP